MSGLNKNDIQAYFDKRHPKGKSHIRIEETGERSARLRLIVGKRHLREGNTVSGPSLMGLADAAMFVAILAQIGPVFAALTSNLNINFLRKPQPVDVIAECKLLKVGKRLVFGEVLLFSDGQNEPVAHVTCTYSIPPQKITSF